MGEALSMDVEKRRGEGQRERNVLMRCLFNRGEFVVVLIWLFLKGPSTTRRDDYISK